MIILQVKSLLKLSKHLKYSLEVLIEQLLFISDQIKDIEQNIKDMFSQKPLAKKLDNFLTHPGVGNVIATQFTTEIFDPKRFKDKTQIAKFIGLAPTVHQSTSFYPLFFNESILSRANSLLVFAIL